MELAPCYYDIQTHLLMKHIFLLIATMFLWAACSSPKLPQDVAEAYKLLPDKIDYNQHVKPILSDRCFSCHGPDKGKLEAGLRLDIKEAAYAELPGTMAFLPLFSGSSA